MQNQPDNSDSMILLVSPDAVGQIEGQRGWSEEVRKRVSSLVEVKLDPSILEGKMAVFLNMVGRLFQQAEQQVQPKTTLILNEIANTRRVSR